MARIYTARLQDGSTVYYDNGEWKPLVHGETRLTNSKGEPVLWNANKEGFTKEADFSDYLQMGMATGYDAVVRAGEQFGFWDEDKAQQYQRENPIAVKDVMPSPEFTQAQQEAQKGITNTIGQIVQNPLDYAAPIIAQSAPLMAVPLATAGMGLLVSGGNPLGAIAGAGVGSFAINEPSKYNEVLQELAHQNRVDPNSDAFAVFANRPEIRQEAQRRALAYSAPVAGIDALSMGLGGASAASIRALQAARGVAPALRTVEQTALASRSIPGAIARGVGTQVGLGAGSEVAGQVNETGSVYDPEGVVFEAAMEVPGGSAEIAMSYLAGAKPATTETEKAIEEQSSFDARPVTEEDFFKAANVINPTNVEATVQQLASSGPAGVSVVKKVRTASELQQGSTGIEFTAGANKGLTQKQQAAYGKLAEKKPQVITQGSGSASFAPRTGTEANVGVQAPEGLAPELVASWAQQKAQQQGLPADIARKVGSDASASAIQNYNNELIKYLEKIKRSPGFRKMDKDAKNQALKESVDLFNQRFGHTSTAADIPTTQIPNLPRPVKAPVAKPVDLELQDIEERNRINRELAANPPGERHLGGDYMLNAEPEGLDSYEAARSNLVNSPAYQSLTPQEKAAAEKELYLRGTNYTDQLAQADLNPSMTSTKPRVAKARANVSDTIEALTAETRKRPLIFDNAIKKYSASVLDFPTKGDAGLQMYNQDLASNKGLADILRQDIFREKATKQREAAGRKAMGDLLLKETDSILKGVLNKVGILKDVNPIVTLEKLANAAGGYVEGKTIVISALQPEGRSIESTINHEVIHVLRNLGLISVPEWNTLTKAAKQGNWVNLYGFDSNPEYASLGTEGLLEEAVAEHFAQTRKLKNDFLAENEHLVSKIMNRVKKFLGYLRGYINTILGVSTPDEVFDLFDKIESGELVNGRVPADGAFQREGIQYSKALKDKVKQEKDFLAASLPEGREQSFKEELKNTSGYIGHIGWWFRDLQNHAARIPSLRPLFHLAKAMEQEAHSIRTYATNKLVPILKLSKEERQTLTKAAAFLRANETPMPSIVDKDGTPLKELTITLNKDFGGLGLKAGESVTLNQKQLQHLKTFGSLMQGLRKQVRLSTINEQVAGLLEIVGNPTQPVNTITTDLIDTWISAHRLTGEDLEQANFVKKLVAAVDAESKNFYTPAVRQSPYFFTIYDKSKPVAQKNIGDRIKTTVVDDEPYERIATINLPASFFGKMMSEDQVTSYMQRRLEAFKITNPDAFIPVDKPNMGVVNLQGVRSAAEIKNFVTSGQFDVFEQLALVHEIPNLSDDEKKALIRSMRQAWATKGFDVFEKKSQNLQGYIHDDNITNYLVGAGSVYADRAAQTIAKNMFASPMNAARATLSRKVMNGELHKSVKDYADDYVSYVFSNQNEFARVRGWMFNWFLGMNPSSAFLNMFQVLHSSLPVLTNMYGSPGQAAKALAKYSKQTIFSSESFVRRGDPFNPNPYKDIIESEVGDLTEHEKLVFKLIQKGTLRPHTIEEMQARDVSLQLDGTKEDTEGFTNFTNKAGNLFSYMFNRVEATTRVVTALAAYDEAKKARSNPKVKAQLEKFLSGTAWEGSDVTDAQKMAEIAVELSHPDTTKFNRAKAFRGALAVPTQFLAFPIKILDMYLSMLGNATGVHINRDGKVISFNKEMTTPEARKAFAVLFLGLMFTSGLSGAIPFGEPAKDLYDKLYKLITGIDPDIESELRASVVDLTGSPMFAEMLDKGFLRALSGVDVSGRMGVQITQGVSTDISLLNLLGPTGSALGTIREAFERYEQGHTTLALAALAPAAIRNPLKAMYANEYGVVTQKGNIIPSDYDFLDTMFQAVGFTPTKVARAREEQFASDRLSTRTSVARERAYDSLVTLRVKAILARQRGEAEDEQAYNTQFREYMQDLNKQNQAAEAKDRVKIDMQNVTKRVLEQLRGINQGEIRRRRGDQVVQKEQQELQNIYPRRRD